MKATPGPWVTMRTPSAALRKDAPSTITTAHGAEREVIARVVGPNAVANGRLLVRAPELAETVETGAEAAETVVARWESGDLAGAVNALREWAEGARELLAEVRP